MTVESHYLGQFPAESALMNLNLNLATGRGQCVTSSSHRLINAIIFPIEWPIGANNPSAINTQNTTQIN